MEQTEPTDTEVASLCQSVLQMNGLPRVERALEGSDNRVWFVDDNLVIRLASETESSRRQSREIALRELVRTYVADPGVIPRCVASGYWKERGVAFCIEARLFGVSLESGVSALPRTEADLIALLSALKAVPVDSAVVSSLPVEDDLDLEELESSARVGFERLATNGQLPDIANGGAALSLDNPDLGTFAASLDLPPPVLLHADLKGEHILLEKSNGAVVGILDWTDAKTGDPAVDIGGLAISVGSDMAARVGLGAGYSKCVVARGIFLARCDAFAFLDERLNGEDDTPIELLRKQLDRASEYVQL